MHLQLLAFAAANTPICKAPLNTVLGGVSRCTALRDIIVLALLLVPIQITSADEIPCPTFKHRSVNCTNMADMDDTTPITVLSTDESQDFRITDSSSAIFAQFPSKLPPRCQLIGSIDIQIDLSMRMEPHRVVYISQLVEDLGANYVVFRKPLSGKWSKLYYCFNLN